MSMKKGISFPGGFSSGMFPGTLTEDFWTTANTYGKPFMSVKVHPFFDTLTVFPLTLCPTWLMVYDFGVGDTVYVKFDDNDPNYPIFCFADKDLNFLKAANHGLGVALTDNNGNEIDIDESGITLSGTVVPTGEGPLCGIPICPFVLTPQTGPTSFPGV